MSSRMTDRDRFLILIPTYNEAENVGPLFAELKSLQEPFDYLFVDDNSPDGTGRIIDKLAEENAEVIALHREGKLGVGSAHKVGIRWAYEHGYRWLLSMDCDFTHSPQKIAEFIKCQEMADHCIVVGSRFVTPGSLSEWVWYRRVLTHLGHTVTRLILGMPYDSTGAFRLYDLERTPREAFDLVRDDGYSFFWESLYILWRNGCRIGEVGIDLPRRTYGHSKLGSSDVFGGAARVLGVAFRRTFKQQTIFLPTTQRFRPNERAEWDSYWQEGARDSTATIWYDRVARFYRKWIIERSLNHYIDQNFTPDSLLLHAGCGSGEVDHHVVKCAQVTALDISDAALARYSSLHNGKARIISGDLRSLPIPEHSFDGVYNLGVMEHFDDDEIERIMREFSRVLTENGRVVIFWPPSYGLSVFALRAIHFVLNSVLRRNVRLHPHEPSLIRSRTYARSLLERCGFDLKGYYFGPRDLFTYAVVVGEKVGRPISDPGDSV